jgi:hypothetical protein
MDSKSKISVIWLAIVLVCLGQGLWAQSANVTVFASGFNNPRGLKFGPDGYRYVAEGGAGGNKSTAGVCRQVPARVHIPATSRHASPKSLPTGRSQR